MKRIEKETILYQIEVLKNYVKMYYELPDDQPSEFKKIIERLKMETMEFKKLYDINTRNAEKTTDEVTKTYYEAKSRAYSIAYKYILQVINDFDEKNL